MKFDRPETQMSLKRLDDAIEQARKQLFLVGCAVVYVGVGQETIHHRKLDMSGQSQPRRRQAAWRSDFEPGVFLMMR